MPYTYSRPTSTSFTGKGLLGYSFGPLVHNDIDAYYIETEKGHDTFMISKKITRLYYILSGSGYFTIDGVKHDVTTGMFVEVPPKVEYSYSGRMTILAVSIPGWFQGNDTHTRWNPDVVEADIPYAFDEHSGFTRLVRLRILGIPLTSVWLRLNRRLWNALPASVRSLRTMRSYGAFLHALAKVEGVRGQAFSTYFLRNRPQLEMIRRIVERLPEGDTVRVAVLACSTGAEAYSVAWRIRSARPDLKVVLSAIDISRQAVEFANQGKYLLDTAELTNTGVLERMTGAEIEQIFERDGNVASVRLWIREGISWHVGDAGDPATSKELGSQDIVVANNFLCHMSAAEADACLRKIGKLVKPNGYLFVSGVDLDVRTKVAMDLGWHPVLQLLEEIHEGDPGMRDLWPFHYGGLEPMDKNRHDWQTRYAAVFQMDSGTIQPGEGGDVVSAGRRDKAESGSQQERDYISA